MSQSHPLEEKTMCPEWVSFSLLTNDTQSLAGGIHGKVLALVPMQQRVSGCQRAGTESHPWSLEVFEIHSHGNYRTLVINKSCMVPKDLYCLRGHSAKEVHPIYTTILASDHGVGSLSLLPPTPPLKSSCLGYQLSRPGGLPKGMTKPVSRGASEFLMTLLCSVGYCCVGVLTAAGDRE